ncbi:hypothetical protein FRB94_010276 [Tulasnella sp. JGI-2019a]|nr:hypothetical protein FRB94_010276 [Tulasnella sp. JGI-2019a]KAG9012355.1 hypothetical protein FRB93_001777 [Tulasnella sp. JGI-2019a]KAG9036144.1 hypothetical protein FRB95_009718 [Tulasnella sp. JGI-2019a]
MSEADAMDIDDSASSSNSSSHAMERTSSNSGKSLDFKMTIANAAEDPAETSSRTISSEAGDEPYSHCDHLAVLLSDPDAKARTLKKYQALVSWYARLHAPSALPESGPRPAKRRKTDVPECDTCQKTLQRPFVCLSCNYGGCWKQGHITDHLQDLQHDFCVDVTSGAVFCRSCDDFVYGSVLESTYSSITLKLEEKETRFQESKSRKRRHTFEPWIPNASESAIIQKSEKVSCRGRRGLLNLGATCYLNVILQTFICNPLMRNHFLSDKHPHKLCKNTNCMCCEMDKLFTEIYSGTQPYGPASFLTTMWKAANEISGYQQQDAHEFLIAVLNQIHTSSRGSTSISCVCVVHSTFAGQLQSDVRCKNCGNVTSSVDLMLDISLDLGAKGQKPDNNEETLAGCLRRFTHPESLDLKCSKCNSSNETTKRLSIRKLPPVLSFTFKRFKHDSTATKMDTYVRFPATLNMAPYTAMASGTDPDPARLGPSALYEYELFAVVIHEGQVNSGHYTNFARFGDHWYHFDDDKVTPSTLRECLKSRAYMCVYVKRHLDYKEHETPSYILKQQQAAEKERLKAEEKQTKELAALAGL